MAQQRKQQRVTKEVLQARFAARLRTTPRHQQAAEAKKVALHGLQTAITAKVNNEVWGDEAGVTFWTGMVEYWRKLVADYDTDTFADDMAMIDADTIALDLVTI